MSTVHFIQLSKMGGNNGSFIGYGVVLPHGWIQKWKSIAEDDFIEELGENHCEIEQYLHKNGDLYMFHKNIFTSTITSRSGIYTSPEVLLIDPVEDRSFMKEPIQQWKYDIMEQIYSLTQRLDEADFNIKEIMSTADYYMGFLAGH